MPVLNADSDNSRLCMDGRFKQKQKHAVAVFRHHFVHAKPSDRFLGHGSMVEKEGNCHGRRAISMQENWLLNYEGPSSLQVEGID